MNPVIAQIRECLEKKYPDRMVSVSYEQYSTIIINNGSHRRTFIEFYVYVEKTFALTFPNIQELIEWGQKIKRGPNDSNDVHELSFQRKDAVRNREWDKVGDIDRKIEKLTA